MKFALFEFCEDNSCAVGESNWMVDQDESSFNNEDWMSTKEVLVHWPKVANEYSKWSKKSGKCALDAECETKAHVAQVLKFNDQYDAIRELMITYLNTGTTNTPLRGRGKRTTKRNDRYLNDTDDETSEMPKKKLKTKRKTISNSSMSESHILQLKEKIAKEKQLKDYSSGSSDDSNKDDDDEESKSYADEISKLRKQLCAKDREIELLKSEIGKTQDMQSLQDVIMDLKDSVQNLKKISSVSWRSKKISLEGPLDQMPQKRPLSPIVHAIKSEASTSSSSDSELDNVTLCHGLEVSRGQQKVLKCKHSAKDFAYAILPMVWSREVLCTHSVSGRQSNAHKDRDAKPQLDIEKVDSICNYVAEKFGSTPKEVRNFLASKINNIIKCSGKKNNTAQN